MSDTNKFGIGAAVKVANLGKTADWAWLVNHQLVGNRRADGAGRVSGYYYLPKNTIVCVKHDADGVTAVYDENELEDAGA